MKIRNSFSLVLLLLSFDALSQEKNGDFCILDIGLEKFRFDGCVTEDGVTRSLFTNTATENRTGEIVYFANVSIASNKKDLLKGIGLSNTKKPNTDKFPFAFPIYRYEKVVAPVILKGINPEGYAVVTYNAYLYGNPRVNDGNADGMGLFCAFAIRPKNGLFMSIAYCADFSIQDIIDYRIMLQFLR